MLSRSIMMRAWMRAAALPGILGAVLYLLLVLPLPTQAQGQPTDGCIALSDCTRQGGTSQGAASYCPNGTVYCHGYVPGSDVSNNSSGASGGITTDPCGAQGASQGKITYCVQSESDCAESPIDGSTSLCQDGQFCCVKKATATASSSTVSGGAGMITLPDPLGGVTLPVLIGNVIRAFAGIAGAIALLMFVYGGIMWIISGGDKGKVAKAQGILKNATIGLILIFGAYFFVATIIGGVLAPPPTP